MKKISLVKDIDTNDLYSIVIRDGDATFSIPVAKSAQTWATWANTKSLLSHDLTQSLEPNLERSPSVELNTKVFSHLQERLPSRIVSQISQHLDESTYVRSGERHRTMGARFVQRKSLIASERTTNTHTTPLHHFHEADRQAVLSFKAQRVLTQQKISTLNIQVKKNRAIFDPTIGPGGGWRCPGATLYGGQITDRFGRGCGGGLTRRIGRALMNAGRSLDDLGQGLDQRRTARRAQRVERQAARADRRRKRIARVGNSIEALAQALIGDYQPLEGIAPRRERRRRRLGADVTPDGIDLPEVPTGGKRRKRRVKPKRTVVSPDAKKPSKREKRGKDAKKGNLRKRVNDALERAAQKLVGDYKPEGKRKKKGDKRGTRVSRALERAARRLVGDYKPENRRRRRRDRRKPGEKLDEWAARILQEEYAPKKPSKKPGKPDGKKPKPGVPDKPDGKKPDAPKKPSKPKTAKQKRADRIKEIDAELEKIDNETSEIWAKPQSGVYNPNDLKRLDELAAKRADLLAERAKLNSTDPNTHIVPGKPAPKPKKPSAKKPEKPAGKQYGGKFTNHQNARKRAFERSAEENKTLIVVKDADGKYRVIDRDRLEAEGLGQPGSENSIYGVLPNGELVEWDGTRGVDENYKYFDSLIAKSKAAEAKEMLTPTPVEKLDLELKKSKTGAFLPDGLNPAMLEDYEFGANDSFIEQFRAQQLDNREFWASRVGIGDGDTAKYALKKIDDYYAEQAAKQPPNENLLGVLRAERQNYIAMNVPAEGETAIDPYERFNYIQPKRRKAIIDGAGLGGLTTTPSKKKKSPKKPDMDASIKPDEPTPISPTPSPEKTPKVTPSSSGKTFDSGEGKSYDVDSLTEEIEGAEFQDFLDNNDLPPDSGITKQKYPYGTKTQDEFQKEDMTPKNVESLDAIIADPFESTQERADNAKELYDEYVQEMLESDNITLQDRVQALDLYRSWQRQENLAKQVEARKAAKAGEALDGNEKSDVIPDVDNDGVPAFSDEEFALVKEGLKKSYKEQGPSFGSDDREKIEKDVRAEIGDIPDDPDEIDEWLEKARQFIRGDLGWNINADDTIDDSYFDEAADVDEIREKMKKVARYTQRDFIMAVLEKQADQKKKSVAGTKIDAPDVGDDKLDDAAGLAQLMDVLEQAVPDFNKNNVTTKVDGWKATLSTWLGKMVEDTNSESFVYLNNIPVAFWEMGVVEQLDFLKTSLKGGTDEKALGRAYRAALLQQYGGALSLQDLRQTFQWVREANIGVTPEGIDFLRDKIGLSSTDDLRARIGNLEQEIKDLQTKYGLPTSNDLVNVLRLGRIQTLKNQLAIHHLLLSVDSKDTNERKNSRQRIISLLSPMPFKDEFIGDLIPRKKITHGKGSNGSAFKPEILGTTDQDGAAVAIHIPQGNLDLIDVVDGSNFLRDGGNLSEVPDELLVDSIKQNLGPNQRFQSVSLQKGYNQDNFAVLDTLTGKTFIVKTEDRNHLGHVQEITGALLANELGFPTVGIRLGSELKDTDLPGARKVAEGVDVGRGRTMVIEHLQNQFPDQEVASFSELPYDAQISPESIARMMVLDRSMNYFDRTPANMFAVKRADGKWDLHPIDHGNAFRPWEKADKEEIWGFTQPTKGDNVDLMSLVKNMSDQDKAEWARALKLSSDKFQKLETSGLMAKIAGSGQLGDSDEMNRLVQHVEFLETRKTELDWDDMVMQAVAQVGFDQGYIADLMDGPVPASQFAGIHDGPPFKSVKDRLKARISRSRRNRGVKVFYDGGSLDNMTVHVADVDAPDGFDGEWRHMKTRLRGSAADQLRDEIANSISENDGVWTVLTNGVPGMDFPGDEKALRKFNFEFRSKNMATSKDGIHSPGDESMVTYMKKMPDGTHLIFSVHEGVIGSSKNTKNVQQHMLQVLTPEEHLDDDVKMEEIFSAVGVTQHGIPSNAQAREYAVRQFANSLLGAANIDHKNTSIDELDARLRKDYGIGVDSIVVRKAPDGEPYYGLSNEAAKRLAEDMGIGRFRHQRSGSGSVDTMWKTVQAGSLLSTERRHALGHKGTGASSAEDVRDGGSGQQAFAYIDRGMPETGSSEGWNTYDTNTYYFIPELIIGRTDVWSNKTDAWGDLDRRQDSLLDSVGSGDSGRQTMIRDGIPLWAGISIMKPDDLDEIFRRMDDAGMKDIDGIPRELIFIPNTANGQEAMEKLRQHLRELGLLA